MTDEINKIERLTVALEIIAGRRQCLDNLMGNVDVACAALDGKRVASLVSVDELNLIKAFWRADPSCLHLKCNDKCNPVTTHCGIIDEYD